MRALAKYKIGLAVIGAFTLVIVAVVIAQASATKQDSATYTSATKIADSLNNYVNQNQTIPDSLSSAGVPIVPPAVTYHKLSVSSYRFCVAYKATSSGFNAASVESNLIAGGALSSSAPSADTTSLYIDSSHHKGQNCQTIKPDTTSGVYSPYGSTGCDPSSADYFNCLQSGNLQPNGGSSNSTPSVRTN